MQQSALWGQPMVICTHLSGPEQLTVTAVGPCIYENMHFQVLGYKI